MKTTGHVIVSTTTDSREAAERIARALVQQRLAACVQISGPLTSVYRWEGKLEASEEWICAAKTMNNRFDQVASAIEELHSYDQPEIIATPIVAGIRGYLEWVEMEVASK